MTGVAKPYDRPAIMAVVVEGIANGKSLRELCTAEGMPGPSTIVGWVAEDEEFAKAYAVARDRQADFYADEIIEIADKAKTKVDAAVARVRIDARKWKASKMAPKKYGDKVDVELEAGPRFAKALAWLPPT